MRISFNNMPAAVVSITLILAVFVTGCAGTYGGMVSVGSYGMGITLEELIRNHEKYHIYYSGPDTTPFAVLFDPKDDQKNIQTGKLWEPIGYPSVLKRMIRAMQIEHEREADLKVIKGYDNTFYGFMYTFNNTVIKHIENDPNTVEVYPATSDYYEIRFLRARGT